MQRKFTDSHGEHIRYTVRKMRKGAWGVYDRAQDRFVTGSCSSWEQAQAARKMIERQGV